MKKDLRLTSLLVAVAAITVFGVLIAVVPGAGPRAASSPEVAARFSQGVVMLHAKQYEHALTAFHRVLELDPAMPEAHVNAGFALLGMGEPAAARDFFRSALELRARQLNAYYGLAVAYERLGDLAAARGAMRTYAHLAPKDDPFRRKAEAALWEWQAVGGSQ